MEKEPLTEQARTVLVATIALFTFAMLIAGCADKVSNHSAELAASKAYDYLNLAYVQGDALIGYEIQTDEVKAGQTLEEFSSKLESIRSAGTPDSVWVVGYELASDDGIILLYLNGDSADQDYYYKVALRGSLTESYKIKSVDESDAPFPKTDSWKPLEWKHQ